MGQEGDDVVLGDALDLVDAGDVEGPRPCPWPRWLSARLLRDDAELGQRVGGMGLDLEPDAELEQSEDDPRACYALVQQRIREYRKAGNSVPDDLVRMERSLMTECMAASQGR
jgi:hypothetical protein